MLSLMSETGLLVRIHHDRAAVDRLAHVAMWGLLVLVVGITGVGVVYEITGEAIPPDVVLFGPLLVALLVSFLASPTGGPEREQTIWDERAARGSR